MKLSNGLAGLLLSLVAGALIAAPVCRAADARKTNVLLIVSDDLAARLACYGDPTVKSPNIDRLAARGVRFDNAYCQFPLCNPSRTSFLTGLRPNTTRVYDNATQFRQNLPNAQSIGQTFLKAGYHVARVGKLYHYGVPAQIGTDGLDDPPSWQEHFNPKGRDVEEDEPLIVREVFDKASGKTVLADKNQLNQMGATLSWLASEGTDEEMTDGKIANRAINLLEENKDKPFFIAAGFFRPHTPYVSPKTPYWGFYAVDSIPLWKEPAGWEGTVPQIALTLRPEEQHMTDDQRRMAIQAYFASISFMDAQVGRILDAVDRLGLADHTVIVFQSDHGYQLGEHRQWQKMSLFETTAKVPLIIAAPGGAKGVVSKRTVELVDLHATLADLAGVEAPKTDGTSLKPLVLDPNAPWDKPAITQVTRGGAGKGSMGYSVRTERWRYTEWGGGTKGTELYDHDADPGELVNLANDPQHAEDVAAMKKLIPASARVSKQ